jgi:hypothetical protein
LVPCNTSQATVTMFIELADPGDGSALGQPPTVEITTPSTVTCGVPTALSATVDDRDGDLIDVRWSIDGALMAPGTSSVTFTGTREMAVVARDARGAATTDRRTVQCG